MNFTMFETVFIQDGHVMSLMASGNRFYIDITKGGFRWKDTQFEDEEFDGTCSLYFLDYDSAVEEYNKLLKEFGAGDYSWEERKQMVNCCPEPSN